MAMLDELVDDAIKQHCTIRSGHGRRTPNAHTSGYTKEITSIIIYYFAHDIHDNQHFTCILL